jgi:hypothetical protein
VEKAAISLDERTSNSPSDRPTNQRAHQIAQGADSDHREERANTGMKMDAHYRDLLTTEGARGKGSGVDHD